jgi:hypothetical protein
MLGAPKAHRFYTACFTSAFLYDDRQNETSMQADHIIFLIHPCCYEPIEPEVIERDGLRLYLDRENQVKARWLVEIQESKPGTLFVQLGGPDYLTQAAESALGARHVLSLTFPFPENQDLDTYYRGLADEIRTHLDDHALSIDVNRVTSELWGESFEGCVPGYGGAFCQYLGLTKPPVMRYEMTVYDSRFLHLARRVERTPISGSDVEAWIFECHDGTTAATFQARCTAQWLDERQVHLRLHDRRHQLSDKLGHTIWPACPWSKGKPEAEHEVSVPMKDWISRWVRGIGTDFDSFRLVINAVKVDRGT